jgi:hypothetical protein
MVKIMDAIKINKIIERPDCAKIYGVFDCEENPSLISGDPVLCLRGILTILHLHFWLNDRDEYPSLRPLDLQWK